jgi:hypothetical protein
MEYLEELKRRIDEGIEDTSLIEVVRLLIPSNNLNLFKTILQQNSDLKRTERQKRSLELYLRELGFTEALQGNEISV